MQSRRANMLFSKHFLNQAFAIFMMFGIVFLVIGMAAMPVTDTQDPRLADIASLCVGAFTVLFVLAIIALIWPAKPWR